jgi:uncharacterized protein (DUF4415 family)
MNKVATRQASNRKRGAARQNKLSAEQIAVLQEAGFTAEQIAALPNVLRLTTAQSDLAIEIGAIPVNKEEVPLAEMVQKSDDDIDFSDIPEFDSDAWANAVVVTPKKTKTLVSIRLDPDIVDFFRMQGKGYQSHMNAVLRAYVDAKK